MGPFKYGWNAGKSFAVFYAVLLKIQKKYSDETFVCKVVCKVVCKMFFRTAHF
jgi:hypothetical protein